LLGIDEPIAQFDGHSMSVTSVAYNAKKIASGSRDTATKVWDYETQKCLATKIIDRNLTTSLMWVDDH
jgi:WD40 repeat protein